MTSPPHATLRAIEYHLPDHCLTNQDLQAEFGEHVTEQVTRMTGVLERRVAAAGECASDLAACAAERLFASGRAKPSEIDFVVLCTAGSDYFLPPSACLLQHRLGISTRAGAFDFNLGCSGYVYGLSLAKGFIETGQAKSVLLLTGETPTKVVDPTDRSIRFLFGDAGTASLIEADTAAEGAKIGPFVFGTDGSGSESLLIRHGGWRCFGAVERDGVAFAVSSDPPRLRMNGAKIYDFMLRTVPPLVREILERADICMDEIKMFVFHQASKLMLERLRRTLRIPESAFCISMEDVGNTSSCTIPIALKRLQEQGRLATGDKILLAGFGVGLSWAATVVSWDLCSD